MRIAVDMAPGPDIIDSTIDLHCFASRKRVEQRAQFGKIVLVP